MGEFARAAAIPAAVAAVALSLLMYHTVAQMSDIAGHSGRRSHDGV